jgi:MurNAc alpha-1-phosphate uridylyltransferase
MSQKPVVTVPVELPEPPVIRAMILCAGLGERLRPLTDELPKPLLPVGDRPVLAHITRELRRAGHEAGVVNTHSLTYQIFMT